MNYGLTITAIVGILQFIAIGTSDAAVASFVKFLGNPKHTEKTKKGGVCSTPECAQAAADILANMNAKVSPCDDFYEFACGGFNKSTTIPDNKDIVDMFSITEDQLSEQLRTSIEESSGPNEPKAFTLAKDFYKSCMNTSAIENEGVQPLLEILKQMGSWPVLEGDNWKGDFDWTEITNLLQRLGYWTNYFITFTIAIDSKNSAKRIIDLDQGALGLDGGYLINGMEDEIVEAYYDYMINLAVILGADKQRAAQELRESLEFEIKLAKILSSNEERRDSTKLWNPMTIAELNKKYPSVNWTKYINDALMSTARVDESEIVNVEEPRYIGDLIELLKTTPKRVQANYVMSRIAMDSVGYLNEATRNIELKFNTKLSGETESDPRWKECLDLTLQTLPISVGALYVREHFKEDAKQNAIALVAALRKEFTRTLKETKWMDDKTRNTALAKLAAMSSYVAYPDELTDDNKLNEYYASLELRPDDFFRNSVNTTLFDIKNYLETLKQPVNHSDWTTRSGAAVVNAYYLFAENSINIPAGILQGAFFNNQRPRYMNYGGIGFIIGHEMTHGFDDQGRQYDKNGNLVDWWAPETTKKYLDKAKCIIYQYGNYTAKSVGMKLNGINTQGENIADNGGIKEAYLAYKEWAKTNGPEPRLPGLQYNPEQMFWISAANVWCRKYRPEALKLKIQTNVHSPAQFRILGSFSNRPEFAADFKCPVGSPMNPKLKCSVW